MKEITKLRLFAIGVIIMIIGGMCIIHKYGNNSFYKDYYHGYGLGH
jgi:hypothetical protein